MTTVPATRPPRAPAPLPMTPGRWLTLMIGVPIALALIGWTGFSIVTGVARASYPVTGTIPLENGQLVASMGGADVTLHQDQARSGTARLSGTVDYSLVHPNFTVIGTAVNLDCRLPTGNCELSTTLDVPADTPVDLATSGGNVQASGIQRDVTMDTAGGDVTLSGVDGNTDLSTGGGNVNAGDLGGIVNYTTAGGDITVNDLFSPHVKLDTGGGNVTLTFTEAPAYLDITSSGGDITVLLPHSTTTQYAISYQTEGGVYSASVPVNLAAKAHTITVDSGGGNVNISEAS
jgi:DUF4097 and DUF4098 domain-containing protein YvlB